MRAVRTPEDRFASLPGFPWSAATLDDLPGYEGLRVARVDEGAGAHTFLCLHGQPTWSYLYRKMIPVFLEAGGRVVAPDFLGFGRSDKPVDDAVYTPQFHRDMLLRLVERLDLTNITLVCQDWGGLLGLTLPLDMPERFSRLIIMNTAFPVGVAPGEGFLAWQAWVRDNPDFSIARLMQRSEDTLTDAEAAAYEAPFPDATHRAGARRFPAIVPTSPDDPFSELGVRAAKWWASEFDGPSFMAVGLKDPVLGERVMQAVRRSIRGCPEPLVLPEAGHFVQEQGEQVARAALQAFGGA
ncbi:MAG: alpha/beta fold hydrolase [Myxococcales bacterium]|nr:alpha/beta fold hydrolase [Myxococcales bacterium]